MRRVATLLLGALLVGGCGGGDDNRAQPPGEGALTIYTSLPMQGASARAAAAVWEGQRLALEDHGPTAGGRAIKLVRLDSSKPEGDTWDPALVEQNAERAAEDPSAIAYLGELDHGGSAISVPVTNGKGLLQISPLDGLTSLTREQPGGPRGGPERYYPADKRTFGRLVPLDLMHATALVDWARERGARSIAILHDDRLFGRAIAAQAVYVADARKMKVTVVREIEAQEEPDPERPLEEATALAEAEQPPDAVVYAGLGDATVAPLLTAIEDALPGAELYAAGLAPDHALEGVDDLRLVAAERPAADYGPKARRVLDRLGAGTSVAALYGYESMRQVLGAIDRAGPNRAAVFEEALRPGLRDGVLGAIELTDDGDVADQRVAAYHHDGGEIEFDGLLAPRPPAPPRP